MGNFYQAGVELFYKYYNKLKTDKDARRFAMICFGLGFALGILL